MSQVTVTICGRQYRMACEDGQEDHLRQLATSFDELVSGLRGRFGEIGDARLTVMAALTVADELSETVKKVGKLEAGLAALQQDRAAVADRAQATQAAWIAAFNSAAARIEDMARKLNQIGGDDGPGIAQG